MKALNLFIAAILITTMAACGKKKETKQEPPIEAGNTKIIGIAKIEPEVGLLNITSGANGKVAQILVNENDHVKKGDVIAILDLDVEKAQLGQSQSKLGTQQNAIKSNEANVNAVKINLDKARQDYERDQNLFSAKAISDKELATSKANYLKLEQDYEKAKADLLQSKSRLMEMQADINYYQTNINDKKILAPYDGEVLSIDIKVGDYIVSSTSIGQFAPAGALIAQTEVDELYANDVKLGMKAEILSQATGKVIAKGTISYLADYLKKKSLFDDEKTVEDRRVRKAEVKLDAGSKVLIGSRVDCIIYLK
jgi:HlyD family secretion protein